jgi:tetratricopeptide (TPR) repeat protein
MIQAPLRYYRHLRGKQAFVKAETLAREGKAAEAAEAFDLAAALSGDDLDLRRDAVEAAADLYQSLGRANETAERAEQLADLAPDDAGVILRLARARDLIGRREDAAAAWARRLALAPDCDQAPRRLADLLSGAAAIPHLRTLAYRAPDDLAAWIRLGEALTAEGDFAGAAEAWSRRLAVIPDCDESPRRLADLLRGAAALPHIRTLAQRAPNDADAWARLALALDAERDAAGAADAWSHLAGLRPDDLAVRRRAITLLLGLNRQAEAAAHLEAAAALDPGDAGLSKALARACRSLGDSEGELRGWLGAARAQPEKPGFRVEIVRLLTAAGRGEEATAHLVALARLQDDDADLWRRSARALAGLGDEDRRRRGVDAAAGDRRDRPGGAPRPGRLPPRPPAPGRGPAPPAFRGRHHRRGRGRQAVGPDPRPARRDRRGRGGLAAPAGHRSHPRGRPRPGDRPGAQARRPAAAVDVARAALAAEPDSRERLDGLVELLLEAGDDAGAITVRRTAVDARPEALDLVSALLELRIRLGEPAGAIADLQQIADVEPRVLALVTGLAPRLAGEAEGLRALLRRALEAHPEDLDLLRALARNLGAAGDLEGAFDLWSRVLRHAPGDGAAARAIGMHLYDLGRRAEAAPSLAIAAAAAPNDQKVWRRLAWARRGEENVDGEIAALRHLLARLTPDDDETKLRLIELLTEARRRGEAEPLLAEMADKYPDDIRLRTGLARARRDRGDADGALAAWRQVLQINPGEPDANYAVGEALAEAGQLTAAADHLAAAAPAAVKQGAAWSRIVRLRREAGDAAGEIAALQSQIAAAASSDLATHQRLAQLLDAAGRPAEAEASLARIAADRPDDAKAARRLARVRAELGRLAEAAEAWTLLLGLIPNDAEAQLALARWRLDQGEPVLAAAFLEAAGDRGPGRPLGPGGARLRRAGRRRARGRDRRLAPSPGA